MSMLYEKMSDIKENIRVDAGMEDELSAPSKLVRITLAAGQASPTGHDPTAYANVSNFGPTYVNIC